MSIRNSMYRMGFTLIILPFLLFTLFTTDMYSRNLKKLIEESLQVVADAQVAEMTDFCVHQKDYLGILGEMDLSQAALRGELDKEMVPLLDNLLYSRVQAMNYLNAIAILSREQYVVACSEEHGLLARQGMEFLLERMGSRPFYISDIVVNEQGERILVAINRIEDENGTLGYVVAELSLDFYESIRERARLWSEATFYLLDSRREIISAGTPEEERKSFVTTEQERSDYIKKYDSIDFGKNPRGSFHYKIGSKDYITYYSDVEYTDWLVMLSVNLDNHLSRRTVLYVLAFFMILLWGMLVIWIGYFASKRIINPIKGISDTLNAIRQKQDYSLRVTVKHRDELGKLTQEINELIGFIETEDLYKIQQQRLLQEKAEQDALTKVLNKERISEYCREAVAQHSADSSTMAVMFVDIDDFKAFNTNYGHSVGDQVLLFLASLLARETDGTVGRVGGDEFLVIVEKPEKVQNLETCLEQVERTAADHFIVRGSDVHLKISCCIGAVRIDFSTSDVKRLRCEELIDMADQAMYQVKKSGKQGHFILEY